MYAVIGVWDLDPAAKAARDQAHARIVEGVGRLPGLVKGYWAESEDTGRAHTVIVFEGRDEAVAFAGSVRANAEEQARHGVHVVSLDVTRVTATTS